LLRDIYLRSFSEQSDFRVQTTYTTEVLKVKTVSLCGASIIRRSLCWKNTREICDVTGQIVQDSTNLVTPFNTKYEESKPCTEKRLVTHLSYILKLLTHTSRFPIGCKQGWAQQKIHSSYRAWLIRTYRDFLGEEIRNDGGETRKEWRQKDADIPDVYGEVDWSEKMVEGRRCDHQARINGPADDSAQRIPCSVVKPIMELVESFRG